MIDRYPQQPEEDWREFFAIQRSSITRYRVCLHSISQVPYLRDVGSETILVPSSSCCVCLDFLQICRLEVGVNEAAVIGGHEELEVGD